jgi:hypothetical protein
MVAATAGTRCAPLVRVPRRDEAWVKPALDHGAEGIVFPLGRFDAPEFRGAVAHAERAVLGAGIPLGAAALTREQTRAILERGYRLPVHGFHVLMLASAVREAAERRLKAARFRSGRRVMARLTAPVAEGGAEAVRRDRLGGALHPRVGEGLRPAASDPLKADA